MSLDSPAESQLRLGKDALMYDLIPHTDPILKEAIEPFDFKDPTVVPIDLACDLAETMLYYKGIGLAANQCGLPYRCFVLCADEIIPCFNPRVVDTSTETIVLEEGCLSYPGLLVKIKRPRKIKVRFADPNGTVVTKTFDGITARTFLHELDYLDGIDFISRASYIEKERALKKIKRMKK